MNVSCFMNKILNRWINKINPHSCCLPALRRLMVVDPNTPGAQVKSGGVPY